MEASHRNSEIYFKGFAHEYNLLRSLCLLLTWIMNKKNIYRSHLQTV